MEYQNLILEKQGNVAIVKINRPDKLNALNAATMEEIKQVFLSLRNDESVYVIILTGSGEKAFVAGADIKELNSLDMISANFQRKRDI